MYGPECAVLYVPYLLDRGSHTLKQRRNCGGRDRGTAVGRRGNNWKGFQDFCLNAKATIWSFMTRVCHLSSTTSKKFEAVPRRARM